MEMIDRRSDNCKEQNDELSQARLHIQELQNNFSGKLNETESKLYCHYLNQCTCLIIVNIAMNHCGHSYFFMSDEISVQVAPAILKMPDFAKLMENQQIWYSNSFFAFQEGYEMRLGVSAVGSNNAKGTHVSVYLHLMKGPHDEKLEQSGHWPLRGSFVVELLNQLNDSDHYSHIVKFDHYMCSECTNRVLKGFMAKKGMGTSRFISHEVLLHHNNSGYCRNNSLAFRISYEGKNIGPPYQVTPLILKVPDFHSKWLKIKGKWYSSPFFAFDEGYLMTFCIYAGGIFDGENTHVSVFLRLMKGPHDDKLEQSGLLPLRGTFTIEILNQFDDNDHYSDKLIFDLPVSSDVTNRVVDSSTAPSGLGIPQFISHDFFLNHSNKYLNNDILHFRITHYEFGWIKSFFSSVIGSFREIREYV